MELEIYEAFISAGINEAKAKAAVESINKEIDKRYSLHADQLATRGDVEAVKREIAEAKTEIIKWSVSSIFVAVGLFATIMKAFS